MTGYLQTLSETLHAYGVDQPIMVVDLDRLDANCVLAENVSDAGLDRRLVAKSLPCLPLLDHIRGKIQTSGLMTFSEPMLLALLKLETKTDHLIGKPLPVSSAARVLSECPDAAVRVQWLIDSPERLKAYLALATDRQLALRLSLEVDIGLHRGGFQPEQVAGIAQEIDVNPNARLSGVMGYEAHLAKLPGFLRKRAVRASADAFDQAVSSLPKTAKGLCLNTGGSLTFQSYRAEEKASEIAFGSVLAKPTDFDHPTTREFFPAAFIATPILKTMPGNSLPGLDFLSRRKTDLAIFGGYFRAQPVFPKGFGYSSVFGRSTSQEVWTGPPAASVKPGKIALLRPTQSEAVLNQFGTMLAVRGDQVVDEWECLPN
ncbi:putative amino acid aldolase or racemase [Ruegeria denitrificans]|uniref:Putative amino acid aldolase or racemase n=1 Tax=Ruegeria denitrificans TaxID=1715692 RepID=A0A0P1I298_9RHOB|nr:alanine racemase [Ruegeria denitrificans]CUJ86144.1 putative amino acid aldolase or racemase [Ruegeria denitrificans]